MKEPLIYTSKQLLAQAAAEHAIATLQLSITQKGSAIWVLAGGSTPQLAYQYIADNLLKKLDWSKVHLLLGDERIGSLESPDNNWQAIDQVLLKYIPSAIRHRPLSSLPVDQAAEEYEHLLDHLFKSSNINFDLVWLGMGTDGHTLSLFPADTKSLLSDQLVAAIHDSPKPPSQRISLTLSALEYASTTVILAAGKDKAAAYSQALEPNSQLPIALAAQKANALWMIDAATASEERTLF